jgi:indole-3-pyruvate monooxygenase
MSLLKFLPIYLVDALVIMHAKLIYGDLSKYGIHRPKIGPFTQKAITGRSPVIDVGAIKKIQAGEIKVDVHSFFFFFAWEVDI